MKAQQDTPNIDDLDRLWPRAELLKKIGFSKRIEGRVIKHLVTHGMNELSLRQLMDQFLRDTSQPNRNIWHDVPIMKQPQFGLYLFKYALARLSAVDLGKAFQIEWVVRLHHYNLKRNEVLKFLPRESDNKVDSKSNNGELRMKRKNTGGKCISEFKTEEIGVSKFQEINIHFPGDVFLLAVWAAASDKANRTPTCLPGTTLHGLAGKFVSMYGINYEKPLSTEGVLSIFASYNITGNPVIRFDNDLDTAAISKRRQDNK